jgi:hypothetical protein
LKTQRKNAPLIVAAKVNASAPTFARFSTQNFELLHRPHPRFWLAFPLINLTTIAMNSQVQDPEAGVEVDLKSSTHTMEVSSDEQDIVSDVPDYDDWSESQGEDAVSSLLGEATFHVLFL